MVKHLQVIGEACLNNARTNHKYKVQTGNLTSSLGYCILVDGNIVHAGQPSGKGKEGETMGKDFLQEMAATMPQQGIVFVMVAGMPYAKYVEAMGLDVLDSSEAMAKKKIAELVEKAFKNFIKRL